MSQTDWQAVRADYENGMSLRALAAKYNVGKSAIGKRKYDEKWEMPAKRTLQDTYAGTNPPNRDVNSAQRAALAVKLRAQKLTFEEIAKRTGYSNASACRKAIMRELQRVVVENVDQLRREELLALDQLQAECWDLFFDKENRGRLFAAEKILLIMERRAKLAGLDARPDGIPDGTTIIREYEVEVSRV